MVREKYRHVMVKLTPRKAEELLESVKRNREISQVTVDKYATLMKEGKWVLENGATMVVDTNGEFRDGQHRAWAVFNSGVTIDVVIAYGVHPDAVRTIDCGSPRSLSDTLVMESKINGKKKIKYSRPIASALKVIYAYETDDIYNASIKMSNEEVYKMYLSHKDMVDSAALICKPGIPCSQPIALALHYILSQVDSHKEKVDEFFDKLITGAKLEAKSPILVLREKFRTTRAGGRASLDRKFVISCILRAWVAFVQGRGLSNIPFTKNLPKVPKRISKKK